MKTAVVTVLLVLAVYMLLVAIIVKLINKRKPKE